MDETGGTLGMDTGTVDPGSMTGMDTTVSAGPTPGETGAGLLPVDLSFLAASARSGSLGRIGEYEIFGVLGRGAMGIVLKGYDRSLNRVVAVKVQDPSIALNRRARARFLREARAVGAINDVNVVTIYKVNVVQERPYLAMEYVAGTLRDRIRAGDEFETVEVLEIALQVARGLMAAHEKGVLHRDIKPANILLEEGVHRVKISDFGLALAGLGAEVTVTPEKVVGTPAYMSPEQVRGEQMDARSDLFSLGCVMYAMIAGRSPFVGTTTEETIQAVCEHRPEPLPASDDPVAGRLNELIMRLLEKEPDARPRTAEEVADDLKTMLAGAEQDRSNDTLPALPESTLPGGESGHPPGPFWTWPALTIASLALATLACLLVWNRPHIDGETDVPPAVISKRPVPSPSWTVGRSGNARFPDLKAALAKIGPGTKLILVDAGPYEGPIVLDDPARFRDLTIESRVGATLVASQANSIVSIRGVPGVTLRNLAISTREKQFGVEITGKAEGVTLDQIAMRSPRDSSWTQVYIHKGASGSSGRPIVVSGSSFEVGQGGVTIQADTEEPVGFVEVRGNQFSGDDEYVHVLQAVHDITIRGNRFVGGQALTINLGKWDAKRVSVINNTFFRAETWLHPADSDPDQEAVIVCNNAILESNAIDAGNQDLSRMARGKWVFHHNYWEPGPEAGEPTEGPLAESRPQLDVISRDPRRPGFLRPAPGSSLARGGCGGEHPVYVGALAPAVDAPSPATPSRQARQPR